MDYPGRRERLAKEADQVLVTDQANITYLSGFTGSNGILFCSQAEAALVTDGRYAQQARTQCPDVEIIIAKDGLAQLTGRLQGDVWFDPTLTTVAELERWHELGPHARWLPKPGLVTQQRRVKDAHEIDLIRTACRIIDRAVTQVTQAGVAGRTERDVAADIEAQVRYLGADDRGFPAIVAAGEHSSNPHHHPCGRIIVPGDLLKIDAGALVDGYHSDMTRTFIVGQASPEQLSLHAAVAAAAAAARACMVAWQAASVPYQASWDVLAEHGLAEAFVHGLGHGVGLEIHEAPILSRQTAGSLLAGEVITIEPGAYLPGGGVRIEDIVVVGDSGPETLTNLPRDLVEID